MKSGQTRTLVVRRDAPETVAQLAGPQVHAAAVHLAALIPSFVPVNQGVVVKLYHRLRAEPQDDGSSRVSGFPPLWHWLEYGTRWNQPYRPIENAARALGLRWAAKSS